MRMSLSLRGRTSPVSRRHERIPVTFLKRSWLLTNPSAYQWMLAVHADPNDLSRIFPGLIRPRDVPAMSEIVELGELEDLERRWRNTARKALGRASGRDWWRAANMIQKALDSWTVLNGSLMLAGINSRELPLDSWLDAAYVQMMRNLDDNERTKLEFELNRPPKTGGIQMTASRQSLAAFAAD